MRTATMLAALLWLAASTAQAAPVITPGIRGVLVTNVTPGASVAIFGYERRTEDGMTVRRRHAKVVHDSDADGTVEYGDVRIDRRSVWYVVDFSTGETAFFSPIGTPQFELPGKAIPRGPSGFANVLEMSRLELEIALLRPGGGMWTLSLVDGGLADRDGETNAKIKADLTAMIPVEAGFGPPPKSYRDGDVFLALDPQDLTSFAGVIGRNVK